VVLRCPDAVETEFLGLDAEIHLFLPQLLVGLAGVCLCEEEQNAEVHGEDLSRKGWHAVVSASRRVTYLTIRS
jgi:hypothetical protein